MTACSDSESMARTLTELNKQGEPFSKVLTTDTFMMTTAMITRLRERFVKVHLLRV